MHDLERIAANLRKLMDGGTLDNQSKLAKAAGISQTNLSNILRMTVNPQVDTLSQLAKALHVETWQLLAEPETNRLLGLFADLDNQDQAALLRVAESLARRSDEN